VTLSIAQDLYYVVLTIIAHIHITEKFVILIVQIIMDMLLRLPVQLLLGSLSVLVSFLYALFGVFAE
jgi:hypothetical protein